MNACSADFQKRKDSQRVVLKRILAAENTLMLLWDVGVPGDTECTHTTYTDTAIVSCKFCFEGEQMLPALV